MSQNYGDNASHEALSYLFVHGLLLNNYQLSLTNKNLVDVGEMCIQGCLLFKIKHIWWWIQQYIKGNGNSLSAVLCMEAAAIDIA